MSLNSKPLIIDGIVGNGRMLAALGSSGELHRLWWPQIACPQHVNEFVFGIFVENWSDDVAWLNGDSWTHRQYYLEDTNCLVTSSTCENLPVAVEVTDFCLPDSDTLVRIVDVTSSHEAMVDVKLFAAASFAICESARYNAVQFDKEHDAMVFYRHRHAFAIGSERECSWYEAGKRRDALTTRPAPRARGPAPLADGHETPSSHSVHLNGTAVAMGMHGALSWNFVLSSEESLSVPIFVSAGDSPETAIATHKASKSRGAARLLDATILYWHRFVQSGRRLHTTDESVRRLFKRSALAIKLMCDKTGAVVAAPEFDEDYTRCGGYSFCWGRDAAYIATALDQAGFHDLVTHFYDWTLKAQSPDGSWAQRHFMDARLAPQWGLQVDETGSIVWGMWQHHEALVAAQRPDKAREFATKVWPAVKRAADFLTISVDPDTKLPLASRDLWEERLGEHVYSAGAVCAGLKCACDLAQQLNRVAEAEPWGAAADDMLDAICKVGWSEERGHFLRVLKLQISEQTFRDHELNGVRVFSQTEDKGYVRRYANIDSTVDASLLGLSVPFNVVRANDQKMQLTATEIRKRLTVPGVGGLKRYEDDHYIGGNPWIVTTLWMGLYDLRLGDVEASKRALQWAIDHQTDLGLLPEQVDRVTGRTAWVVPLTWSHAMYILTVVALDEQKQI
ncbi:glucoamylase [Marchantia polymorpha subsp. ruderalis]|uniref:GH15-like domain-containing protein n=2 Tax=Marchantia polymorpha TaxID=3197 RepID=A0AAF6B4D0_MARPO|nr:hypothetical protein MARPO_0178s0005 [Marchantia polymorpha]BBN06864.1 hypothetical protein Mp_3g24490 [Marchantia polymorpha subsp. ruderalis]|eukprot:PTQ27952.1 hypothetical protein MARPO_0178s0005 [Marchantia polymorpha]